MTTITLPPITVPGSRAGALSVPGFDLPERSFEIDEAAVERLVLAARNAAASAYAPYSKFHVGAAVLMADDPGGAIVTGCNVENSSYGATVCAERSAIFTAIGKEFRKIRHIAVSTADSLAGELRDRSPCGVCRQVMKEFSDEETLIFIDNGRDDTLCDVLDMERLLPFGFNFAPG